MHTKPPLVHKLPLEKLGPISEDKEVTDYSAKATDAKVSSQSFASTPSPIYVPGDKRKKGRDSPARKSEKKMKKSTSARKEKEKKKEAKLQKKKEKKKKDKKPVADLPDDGGNKKERKKKKKKKAKDKDKENREEPTESKFISRRKERVTKTKRPSSVPFLPPGYTGSAPHPTRKEKYDPDNTTKRPGGGRSGLGLGLGSGIRRRPSSAPLLVLSPRPLPEEFSASPSFEATKRNSLNGNYIVGEVLGVGGFGEVRKAINLSTFENVAVKIVKKTGLKKEAETRLRREYTIMYHLKHDNLVRLIEIVENPQEILIVMELAEVDLFAFMTNGVYRSKGRLSESDARKIFTQIANGLHYLHTNNFVHRDLKLENILLCRDGRVLISDFGFGTRWDEGTVTKAQCGSLFYAAPEIIACQPYIGPEVDMWSLGVMLYAMLTGEHAFSGKEDKIRLAIQTGDYVIPTNRGLSDASIDLIRRLMTVDIQKRITIDDVLRHDWLKQRPMESEPECGEVP